MGSFVLALAGALDFRLRACVLVGGGNLDGYGEYWDSSKPMCQGLPYRSLSALGDRAATLYALHAARGPTLVYNGLEDSTVKIPPDAPQFFAELQGRVERLRGSLSGIFETGFAPGVGHRPFFLTRPVALWLERNVDLPNWSLDDIESMDETHVAEWALDQGVALDPLYESEHREGETRALGPAVPGLRRETLKVFTPELWLREQDHLTYEAWLNAIRRDIASPTPSR